MSAKSKDRNAKNVLEWVVFAISSLLVAGVVGFLVWSTLAGNGKLAAFNIEIGSVTTLPESSVVQVKVTNTGSQTAAEVNLSIVARYPGGEKETGLTIDFIPRGGTRDGYAVFQGQGTPEDITARVQGYIEP